MEGITVFGCHMETRGLRACSSGVLVGFILSYQQALHCGCKGFSQGPYGTPLFSARIIPSGNCLPYLGASFSFWPENFSAIFKTGQRVSRLQGWELWDVKPRTSGWPCGRSQSAMCKAGQTPARASCFWAPAAALPSPLAVSSSLQLHRILPYSVDFYFCQSHFEFLTNKWIRPNGSRTVPASPRFQKLPL